MSDTESESLHQNLEKMTTRQILEGINQEDRKVADAVAAALPALENLADAVFARLRQGGRLFYIGAGTSGRLGVLDASECPPTFGVPADKVVGIIAGGDRAIRKAVEHAEDSLTQGWEDLQHFAAGVQDFVIGIAASGRTPYVLAALQSCKKLGIQTGCIVCNLDTPIAQAVDYPIELTVGPEFLTGSTRMKAGTAQKLVLNMISTAVMIRLGYVAGNRMVNMQLSNDKLIERGTQMVMAGTGFDYEQARELLLRYGSARLAIASIR